MFNIKLLSYSNILTAIEHEISPRAYKVLLDDILDNPHTLTNNGLLSHALITMDDEAADYLFTRLESMSRYFEGVADYQGGLTA
tara:strand:+ start:160 stop:411 length:252 start_codon:yes stop_codon:yes gene_type:complete